MKLHLPKPGVRTSLIVSTAMMSANQAYAQTEGQSGWTSSDIDNFVTEMQSVSGTNFGTWDAIIDNFGTPHSSADPDAAGNVFKIEAGSTILKPDGNHEVTTEDIYLTKGGIRCDSTGTPYLVPYPTEDNPAAQRWDTFEYQVVLKNDLTNGSESYKAGTIVLGTYPNPFGASINGTYAAGNNSTHDTSNGTSIRVAYQDDPEADNYLELVAGKLGGSTGSAEAPVVNKVLIDPSGAPRSWYNTSLQAVYGGNATTDTWLDSPSMNADFYGDTYITLQGGERNDYGGYDSGTYAERVVGGNRAQLQGNVETGQYSANFTGDTHIALQGNSWADVVVGGNYVDAGSNKYTPDLNVQANFNGNVHIVIEADAWAGQVVGGNYGNSPESNVGSTEAPANVRIDVMAHDESYPDSSGAAEVQSVTGASFVTSKHDTTFTGNTDINIHSSQIGGSIVSPVEHVSGVKGGFNSYSSSMFYDQEGLEGTTATLVGNTNVTLDFANKAQHTYGLDFTVVEGSIVGGSFATHGLNVTHKGNSTLELHNLRSSDGQDVEFNSYVVGGNVNGDYDIVDWENKMNLDYSSKDQSHMSIGHVKVSVDSGRYYDTQNREHYPTSNTDGLFTVGSLTLGGGSVHTDSTEAHISGGDFQVIVGGNAAAPSTSHLAPQALPGETYTDYGTDSTVGTTSINEVDLNITGGKSQMIVGGSYISDKVTHITKDGGQIETQALTVGDVDVHVTGGEHTHIVGGSYVGQNITQGLASPDGTIKPEYKATQGDINLKIEGDTVIGTAGSTSPNIIAAAGMYTVTNTGGAKGQVGIDYFWGTDASGAGSEGVKQANGLSAAFVDQFVGAFLAIAESTPEGETFDFSKLTYEQLFAPAPVPTTSGSTSPGETVDVPLTFTTASTTLELSNTVTFNSETIVTGGYYANATGNTSATGEYLIETENGDMVTFTQLIEGYKAFMEEFRGDGLGEFAQYNPPEFLTVDTINAWLDEWADSYTQSLASASGGGAVFAPSNITVTGNRLLKLNSGVYSNIQHVTFTQFDEITIDRDSVVDFSINGQDLDNFAGRHVIDETGTAVIADDYSGTNTLRKTGEGVLKLSDTNGQLGTEDDLQLVVEQGRVVLAANSVSTDKTNFKTLVVKSGATLDMSAGSNVIGTAAGINGHLNLEQDARLIADASRHELLSGTGMVDGALTVNADFMLNLNKVDEMQSFENTTLTITGTAPDGMVLPAELQLGQVEIVLFSDLYTINGMQLVSGTWDGENVQIGLASEYISLLADNASGVHYALGNGDMVWDDEDLYFVLKENGDLVLTSGTDLRIPEPSSATLSLLALAGIMARRRRARS